jgi:hypothetical protein
VQVMDILYYLLYGTFQLLRVLLQENHSALKLFTGLAIAALMACQLMVSSVSAK